MLTRKGITQSMSRKGNWLDNAVIESFFGTLKTEYLHLVCPAALMYSKRVCMITSAERIKLGLQGLSPVEYRLRNTACSAAP